jgi:hypothetical protein
LVRLNMVEEASQELDSFGKGADLRQQRHLSFSSQSLCAYTALDPLGGFGQPDLRYEYWETEGGPRTGSMVPFSLRLLYAGASRPTFAPTHLVAGALLRARSFCSNGMSPGGQSSTTFLLQQNCQATLADTK